MRPIDIVPVPANSADPARISLAKPGALRRFSVFRRGRRKRLAFHGCQECRPASYALLWWLRHAGRGPKILEYLRAIELKSTFFIPGWVVDAHPAMCKAIAQRMVTKIGHHGLFA